MRRRFGIALLVGAVVLGACSAGSDGGPTASASPATASASHPTASPTTGSPAVASASPSTAGAQASGSGGAAPTEVTTMSPAPFSLSSTAFGDGQAIPRRYSCDGEDASPDLSWEGAPEGTQAFALIVTDPDARGFVHWLIFDMTGTPSGGLPTAIAASPDAPPQGTNAFGRRGYGGPCPPSGTHHYDFVLYALDQALGLTGAPRIDEVRAAIDGHVLAEAKLTGIYHR